MSRPVPLFALVAMCLVGVPLAGCVSGPAANPTSGAEGNDSPTTQEEGGFSDTDVFPGNYTTSGDYSKTLEEGPYDARPLAFVRLESPVDRVPIGIELHRPAVPEGARVPVIAYISPYFGGPGTFVNSTDPETLNDTYAVEGQYSEALVENLVPHGYAVALISLRGTAESGGCYDPLGPTPRHDVDHALTWLAERDWSTGHIGVAGIFSADGHASWQAAATRNPHVETIVPAASAPDLYRNRHYNGTWYARGTSNAALGPAAAFLFSDPPSSLRNVETLASKLQCPEVLEHYGAAAHGISQGGSVPTGFWEERNVRDDVLEGYNGSVFVIHGLQDPLVRPHNVYPFVNRLEQAGTPVKHLLGQWGHTRPDSPDGAGDHVRWDFMETLLHWFDYWVKGNRSRDLGPRVQVEDTAGNWRSAQSWPPERAGRTTFYLRPNGSLGWSEASETGSALVVADPSRVVLGDASGCRTCVTFSTPPLEEQLRFAGAPHPHLTVTPTAPRGYLTVNLLFEGPEGQLTYLTGGQMDLRFHDGGRSREPLTPGETVVARMELEPKDAVVPEGSRLLLQVGQGANGNAQGSDADLVTQAGQSQTKRLPDTPAPVRLEIGDGQSTLTLQTFDVAQDAFFSPPDAG